MSDSPQDPIIISPDFEYDPVNHIVRYKPFGRPIAEFPYPLPVRLEMPKTPEEKPKMIVEAYRDPTQQIMDRIYELQHKLGV